VAEQLQPDLIALDLNLPSLSGLEAARRIRKLSPDSRIVMASEECSDDIVQEAISSGVLGYVRKSEMDSQLVPTIESGSAG
jgi:two-component system, NarL family, response regulator LiaR